MRVLITGGTGLLGKALIETNTTQGQFWAIYFGNYSMDDSKQVKYFNVDICNKNALENIFFEAEPGIVIHTAGIANVDYCEKNYKEAHYSNVIGTRNVINFCERHNSKIIYISTNAIFDGKTAPYSEEDPRCPINNYGRIKLECEEAVKNSSLNYLIVRPILMYGWNNKNERSNLVTWLLEKLQHREKVNIVNDIYENPLLNYSCAEIIWSLAKLNKQGTYHAAGKDIVNRYEFAKIIAEVFCMDKSLINPVSSEFFRDLARRPKNTSYNTKKIENELGIRPLGIREGLLLMKERQREQTICQK